MEEWKQVPDTNGFYDISNYGNIRSWNNRGNNKSDRRDKPRNLSGKWSHGYKILHDSINDKYLRVNRLVLRVFVSEPPDSKPLALHKDGDRSNNHVSNLYWGDYVDNSNDMIRHGNGQIGSISKLAKISETDVMRMRDMYLSGISVVEICDKYPINIRNTYSCISGEHWCHVGYRLKEVDDYKGETRELKRDEVVDIKRLLEDGVPQKEIAEMYNSTRANICNINIGRTWSHVQL